MTNYQRSMSLPHFKPIQRFEVNAQGDEGIYYGENDPYHDQSASYINQFCLFSMDIWVRHTRKTKKILDDFHPGKQKIAHATADSTEKNTTNRATTTLKAKKLGKLKNQFDKDGYNSVKAVENKRISTVVLNESSPDVKIRGTRKPIVITSGEDSNKNGEESFDAKFSRKKTSSNKHYGEKSTLLTKNGSMKIKMSSSAKVPFIVKDIDCEKPGIDVPFEFQIAKTSRAACKSKSCHEKKIFKDSIKFCELKGKNIGGYHIDCISKDQKVNVHNWVSGFDQLKGYTLLTENEISHLQLS